MEREPRVLSEKRLVGHHEAGHALVAIDLPNVTFISATAEPNGRVRGLTKSIIHEAADKKYFTKRAALAAASRYAEAITGNHDHSGCAEDNAAIEQVRMEATIIYGPWTADCLITEGQQLSRHIIYNAGAKRIMNFGDEIAGFTEDEDNFIEEELPLAA